MIESIPTNEKMYELLASYGLSQEQLIAVRHTESLPIISDSDSTNYEKYKLLASYGLSYKQLVAVAKVEDLHELRVLRMLRITFELTLQQAQEIVALAERKE